MDEPFACLDRLSNLLTDSSLSDTCHSWDPSTSQPLGGRRHYAQSAPVRDATCGHPRNKLTAPLGPSCEIEDRTPSACALPCGELTSSGVSMHTTQGSGGLRPIPLMPSPVLTLGVSMPRLTHRATSSMPSPLPRFREYFFSTGLFQCSCTPRLARRSPCGAYTVPDGGESASAASCKKLSGYPVT